MENVTSQAVGVSLKSVARIENNYIYKTGTGVSVQNSDITCCRNLIYSCSRRYSQVIVKPWPQTLSPKPKTKGPWADTKML